VNDARRKTPRSRTAEESSRQKNDAETIEDVKTIALA
jgi:hypothetical protein